MEIIKVPRVRTEDAIKLFDGIKYRLAKALDISHQTIDQWGEYVPPDRAKQIYDLYPERFVERENP